MKNQIGITMMKMQIDESKSSDSSRERARLLKQGERLTAYSAFAAVALLTLKLLAGLLSGSISLIGDAFDAFSDIFTMSASWFGLRVSQRSPDRRFPYGYYRVENLIGLIVSVFIVFIGAVLLRESIIQILAPTQLRFASMAFAAAIVSIIASFWIFHYLSKVGTRIGSEIILINARERKSDILKSSTVFVSLVFSYIGFLHAGGIVGIILSILILRIGVISTKDTTLLLLDAWTDPELLGSIETIVSEVDGVKEMRDIKLRKSGSFIFGEATVGVSGFLDVKRAHEITDRIEKKLKEEVSHLDMFTVHIEPAKVEKIRICVPISEKNGLESRISEYFGRSPYYVLIDVEKGQIKNHTMKDNPYSKKETRAGLGLSNLLAKDKVNVLIAKRVGEISFHTLRDHFVEIYTARGHIVKGALESFLKESLERMEEHTEEIE